MEINLENSTSTPGLVKRVLAYSYPARLAVLSLANKSSRFVFAMRIISRNARNAVPLEREKWLFRRAHGVMLHG